MKMHTDIMYIYIYIYRWQEIRKDAKSNESSGTSEAASKLCN